MLVYRYKNRKLYSKEESRYVSVKELFEASLTQDVVVIDRVTNVDVTTKTLIAGAIASLTTAETQQLLVTARALAGSRKVAETTAAVLQTVNV